MLQLNNHFIFLNLSVNKEYSMDLYLYCFIFLSIISKIKLKHYFLSDQKYKGNNRWENQIKKEEGLCTTY